MYRSMFRSKIHRATVTGADLNYEGSVTIDADLLAAADILPNQQVEIWNVTNGERFSTYALRGPAGLRGRLHQRRGSPQGQSRRSGDHCHLQLDER